VCIEMTAIRRAARSDINRGAPSATVRRSRVEPAPGDAAEGGTRERQAKAHNF